jgi:hypothetical protein
LLHPLARSTSDPPRGQSSSLADPCFGPGLLLVGLVLAIRFLTFSTKAEQSVLFSATHGESRYEHFFTPLNLRSASDLSTWIFDRFGLTGPTLFLLAYTVGVWLRHQYPGPPSSPAGNS